GKDTSAPTSVLASLTKAPIAANRLAASQPLMALGPGSDAAPTELPASPRVRLLSLSAGSLFKMQEKLSPFFTTDSDRTGYTVVPGVADVDTLKSVNGDGVFYLESHGGGLNSDKDDEWKNRFCAYSMMTATPPNRKNEELYKTDLEEGCLGYMW